MAIDSALARKFLDGMRVADQMSLQADRAEFLALESTERFARFLDLWSFSELRPVPPPLRDQVFDRRMAEVFNSIRKAWPRSNRNSLHS